MALAALVPVAAWAGVPTIALCEGADSSGWAAEGLVFVPSGEPAVATCRVVEGGWELRARGEDGVLRGVTVLAPTSEATRSALVVAANALLDASGRPSVVSAAPPAAESAAPPELGPPPPPPPTLAAAESAPADASTAATTPGTPVGPASKRPSGAWLSMEPRVHYRFTTEPTVALSMSGGGLLFGQLWIGPELSVLPTRGIPGSTSGADAIKDFVAELRVGWSPLRDGAKLAPAIQAGFGVAAHQWQFGGAVVQSTLAPVASVNAGLALFPFADAPRTALVPYLRGDFDLGTTQVGGTRGVPVALSPVAAELGLSLRALVE